MEKLARILSWVFIPLNAPVFALAIAAYLQSDSLTQRQEVIFLLRDEWKFMLVLVFAFFSVVIPAFTILFLRSSGLITTVMMDNRKERLLPSLFVNASAIALYFVLQTKDPDSLLPSAIYGLAIGSFATVFICTIITQWWKVSLHAAGMGIISGFLFAYYGGLVFYEFWVLPLSLIASGLVMSARMYLGKHTLAQCLVGYLIGIVSLVITLILFKP